MQYKCVDGYEDMKIENNIELYRQGLTKNVKRFLSVRSATKAVNRP